MQTTSTRPAAPSQVRRCGSGSAAGVALSSAPGVSVALLGAGVERGDEDGVDPSDAPDPDGAGPPELPDVAEVTPGPVADTTPRPARLITDHTSRVATTTTTSQTAPQARAARRPVTTPSSQSTGRRSAVLIRLPA